MRTEHRPTRRKWNIDFGMYKLILIFAVFGFACNSKVKNNSHNTEPANDVTQISGLELFSNEPLKNDLVDFFVGCHYCPSNIAMADQEGLVNGIVNFLKQQTGAGQYFFNSFGDQMSFDELFPLSENQFISNIIKCEYKGLVFVNICFNLNEPYILSRLTLIIDLSGVLVDAFQSYYLSDTKSGTSTEQFITHAMVDHDELILQLVKRYRHDGEVKDIGGHQYLINHKGKFIFDKSRVE